MDKRTTTIAALALALALALAMTRTTMMADEGQAAGQAATVRWEYGQLCSSRIQAGQWSWVGPGRDERGHATDLGTLYKEFGGTRLKEPDLANVVNQIGAQGWELVGIDRPPDGAVDVCYWFKRPAQ